MEEKNIKQRKTFFIYKKLKHLAIVFLFLPLILTVSCKISPEDFKRELDRLDSEKDSLSRVEYSSRLKKLRSKAGQADQFLSIAKREYQYELSKNACDTLIKGIKKTADVDLIAFLTFLAIQSFDYEIAIPYVAKLYGSAYESLATELIFKNSKNTDKQNTDYDFLLSAFDETKDEAFLVDAALCLILKGRLEEALELRNMRKEASSEYPYFWAELAFDTGDFSIIVEELKYTLAKYDLFGADDKKLQEETKAHILLAADGQYGLGEIERARGYWTLYTDIFSEENPLVFYDLALTSYDRIERSKALYECVERFPAFYPAVASYVREYTKYQEAKRERKKKASLAENEVESFLTEKGIYTEDMQDFFLQGQFFTLTPEKLLTERSKQYNDPRFSLELLRLQISKQANIKEHTAKVWTLLEQYPDSTSVINFAKWYFSKLNDFEAVFSIRESDDEASNAFYTGIKASLEGKTAIALKSYKKAFSKEAFACAARVNYACTKALLGESHEAIKMYKEAINYTKKASERSLIYFRIAEIVVELKDYERAKDILQYALELDKSNYLAINLLQELRF